MGASPGWSQNYDPPAAEWNYWWSSKVDAANPILTGPLVPFTWTTATRPTAASNPPLAAYFTGFNTTLNVLETWNGTSWTTLANKSASYQAQPSAPAAPASTSAYTMQGLAGSITPATSGNLHLTISGVIVNTSGSTGVGIRVQISYGTGTAPVNGAALTGTQIGTVQLWVNPTTVTAGDVAVPFSTTAIVTGLTAGTAYWIDLAAEAIGTASDASIINISVSVMEFQ